MPKVGIEPSPPRTDQPQTAAIGMIGDPADASDSAPKCAMRGVVDDSLDDSVRRARLPPVTLVGVVETALARALTLAADAGRWGIVAQLAEELAARQRARERAPAHGEETPAMQPQRRNNPRRG